MASKSCSEKTKQQHAAAHGRGEQNTTPTKNYAAASADYLQPWASEQLTRTSGPDTNCLDGEWVWQDSDQWDDRRASLKEGTICEWKSVPNGVIIVKQGCYCSDIKQSGSM